MDRPVAAWTRTRTWGGGIECGKKFLREDDKIEDVMSQVAMKALSNPTVQKAVEGRTLAEARSYILQMVANACRDLLRQEKIRRRLQS